MEREFSLNIKQTAGLYGVSADTLRYYEAIGLVAPKRGANAYREYRRTISADSTSSCQCSI